MSVIQIQETIDSIFETQDIENYNSEKYQQYIHKIQYAQQLFQELENVWDEKEKYSLHWAFDNAATTLHGQIQEIEKNSQKVEFEHKELEEIAESAKQEISQTARQYELLSTITMSLDIIISVILILGVTLIAQAIEKSLHSFTLVILFIGFIALLKVSLDRFFIIPAIDNWGWRRYHELTHSIEAKIAIFFARKMVIQFAYNPNV